MKILKYILIFIAVFVSLAFSLNKKPELVLRYAILPIENSEKVFSQCSREIPKYTKTTTTADSVYLNALDYLIENRKKIKKLVNLKIEDYTFQLTSYKHHRKNYIYINANITDLEMEDESMWKEFPIIWCDGSSSSWGAIYDIEQNVIIDFQTNGPSVQRIDKI